MTGATVAVIAWDGGFRESYHTVSAFGELIGDTDRYRFLWVEHGELGDAVRQASVGYPGVELVALGRPDPWHVGRCMRAGLKRSNSELVALVDGDVLPESDFFGRVESLHAAHPDSAIYARRWDGPTATRGLTTVPLPGAVPDGRLNYGGCLTIPRRLIDAVGGYEQHEVFAGPGAVNGELAARLVNAGVPIVWPTDLRVFHPWHEGTLPSTATPRQRAQQVVMHERNRRISSMASEDEVDEILAQHGLNATGERHASRRVPRGIKRRLLEARSRLSPR